MDFSNDVATFSNWQDGSMTQTDVLTVRNPVTTFTAGSSTRP
uniref:Uncharacterized protein n=1 Tax=Sphingomonas sp. NS2 TaxID=908605 RepID=A0A0D4ZYP2_9SPHN|nr:hypothetical protein plasmid201_209 [Sphingomonas sp. NS2]